MSEQPTLKVNISKSRTGWSILTEVKYPEFTHPAHTSTGASTLNHALWKTLDPRNYVDNIKLIELTVKGQPMTPADAFKRIEKDLTSSCLSYAIPRYKAFLQWPTNLNSGGVSVRTVGASPPQFRTSGLTCISPSPI